jgi:hypothetical protein
MAKEREKKKWFGGVAGETENIPFFFLGSQAVPARPSGKDGITWRKGKELGSETYGEHEYH